MTTVDEDELFLLPIRYSIDAIPELLVELRKLSDGKSPFSEVQERMRAIQERYRAD